jgi:hypothetical protein
MAVSVSKARVLTQFLCLKERLYLRPLLSKVSSSGVNWMLVLLMTLG